MLVPYCRDQNPFELMPTRRSRLCSKEASQPKPGFVPSVDPTEVDRPPSGDDWAHEIKWDGYRVQAHLEEGRATIYTRKGNDWTKRFASIAAAVLWRR